MALRRSAQRDALIAEVKARQRAAGQKVSRLERQGIRVRKEGLDPRTHGTGDFESMSSRQLRAYQRRLDAFTSRDNGYVAGFQGRPISRAAFTEYKRLEARFNRQAAAYESSIADRRVPGTGMTVAGRQSILAQGPRAGGDYRTFTQINRRAANLTGDAAVAKLTASMRKKLDPKYLHREMNAQRKILTEMLKTSGDTDVLKNIRNLSDSQLNLLVGYTSFMRDAGGRYAMAQSISEDTPRWQSQAYENSRERIIELSEWAATQPSDDVTDGPARRIGRRGR